MAYNSANLSALAYANGFTLWHYTSPDAQTAIRAAGYFNSASSQLRVNDLIIIFSATGGTPAPFLAHVNANSGGVVDIVDGLAIPTTDTD